MTVQLPPDIILMIMRLSSREAEEDYINSHAQRLHLFLPLREDANRLAVGTSVDHQRLLRGGPSGDDSGCDSEGDSDCDEPEGAEKDRLLSPAPMPSAYSWIRLAGVSRTWRMLALSTSTLWTHLALGTCAPVRERELVEWVLAHAGTQPLTVTAFKTAGTAKDHDAQLDLWRRILAQKMPQIATLVIPEDPRLIDVLPVRAATRLTALALLPPDSRNGLRRAAFTNAGVGFPALEHVQTTLAASRTLLPLVGPALRTLALRADLAANGKPASVGGLLDALARTPQLEVLRLDLGAVVRPGAGRAALPKLQQLRLSGSAHACAALFRALDVPAHTRVAVIRVPSPDGAIESARAVHALAAAVAPREGLAALECELRGAGLAVSAWRSAASCGAAPPDVRVDLPGASHADAVALLRALPCRAAVALRLKGFVYNTRAPRAGQEPTAALARALATLPSLRVLTLDGVHAPAVIDVVLRTTARRVRLVAVDLAKAHRYTPRELVNQLADVLAARRGHITALSLESLVAFRAADFERVQAVLPGASWDGVERSHRSRA